MNTNNTFKSNEESLSHNFQDSNLKVNENSSSISSALISHGEILHKTNKFIEETGIGCPLPKSNKVSPRLKVSVDFAASQWFQILLIHLNSKNKKLSGVFEPIGGCHLGLNG